MGVVYCSEHYREGEGQWSTPATPPPHHKMASTSADSDLSGEGRVCRRAIPHLFLGSPLKLPHYDYAYHHGFSRRLFLTALALLAAALAIPMVIRSPSSGCRSRFLRPIPTLLVNMQNVISPLYSYLAMTDI